MIRDWRPSKTALPTEAEQAEKDEVERREAMLRGNPLLSSDTTFGAKRR